MTTKTKQLAKIIAQLIRGQRKNYHRLGKGLVLAYTPGSLNEIEPGVYRLTLSRRGSWPSEKEIEIVKRDLKIALKAANRAWSDMAVEEYKRKGTQRYHVIFWIEAVQAALPME